MLDTIPVDCMNGTGEQSGFMKPARASVYVLQRRHPFGGIKHGKARYYEMTSDSSDIPITSYGYVPRACDFL